MMNTKHPTALGWACLTLGTATMFASLWLFPVYGLFYLGAFVLAIVAMRRQQVIAGIVLLLTLLAVPPPLWMMLTVYRGATAMDHGITHVQKHVGRSIEASREREQQAGAARAAEAAARHRTDPTFGVWSVTMWDEHGAVLLDSEPDGGFEQCDTQTVRFSVPVNPQYGPNRVFTVTGGGNRGEWHDDPASDWGGWFEIGSGVDWKTARSIDFLWNNAPDDDGGVPRRGAFTRH